MKRVELSDFRAEIKLAAYEKWGSYAQYLPRNIQRFCEYWGRGY